MITLHGTKLSPRKYAKAVFAQQLDELVNRVNQEVNLDDKMTDRERALVLDQTAAVTVQLNKKLGVGGTDSEAPPTIALLVEE